jgi:hypothetical protein
MLDRRPSARSDELIQRCNRGPAGRLAGFLAIHCFNEPIGAGWGCASHGLPHFGNPKTPH